VGSILVDLAPGEGVYAEAMRLDGNIIIRMKEELFVEFRVAEAKPVLNQLVGLYKEKIASAEMEIRKITASMKEVGELMEQYSLIV
jgi:prefoldin subunit 5